MGKLHVALIVQTDVGAWREVVAPAFRTDASCGL
jgi:hypothetical protein